MAQLTTVRQSEAGEPRAAGATAGSAPSLSRPCPRGTLPDDNTCVPVPELDDASDRALARQNWQVYDQLPRRPDRPKQYARYHWPIPPPEKGPAVLQAPEAAQAGHGSEALELRLGQALGTKVEAVALERQVGEALVIDVNPKADPKAALKVGASVILLHTVNEARKQRHYLVLYGGLEPGTLKVKQGQRIASGKILAKLGDSAQPGTPELVLQVRRVRESVEHPERLTDSDFTNRAHSVACDPRNVFPVKR